MWRRNVGRVPFSHKAVYFVVGQELSNLPLYVGFPIDLAYRPSALSPIVFSLGPDSTLRSFTRDNVKGQQTTMARSTMRNPLPLTLLTSALVVQVAHSQVGTITQDIFTLSAFPLQKPCAQSCFVVTEFCYDDVLGNEIGCNSATGCGSNNWQATNDCYCRTDLQQPAQDYLTSCVEQSCTVGDSRIDASTAGSIYAEYCAQKGYGAASQPATVQATATGPGASTATVGGGVGGGPTASSTSNSQGSSSGSGPLSTSSIIGLVVVVVLAVLVCLACLPCILKKVRASNRGGRGAGSQYPQNPQNPASIHQQPVYPASLYPGPHYHQKTESEVTPDDSISMVGGMPGAAPTLVSDAQYPPRRY